MWLLKIRYAYYFTHIISCPKQFSEGKSAGCKQSYQGLKAKIRDIIAYFHVSREDITWWWRQVTWQWRQCSPLSRRGDRTTFWRELQSEIPYCASSMLIYCALGNIIWCNKIHQIFWTAKIMLRQNMLHQNNDTPIFFFWLLKV